MTEISEFWGGWDGGLKARADADPARANAHSVVIRRGSWRAHQRERGSMPGELGQLRVVPKPQGEHVAVAPEDDGFPPPVLQGFLGDDEMARRDLVPGPGQAGRDRELVWVFADGGLRFDRERHDELAVQALPDVWHEAPA